MSSPLKYKGIDPYLSDGDPSHRPSIWYIRDDRRYRATKFAMKQPGGFAPYNYAFTRRGKALYRYFSIARYDFRNPDVLNLEIGKKWVRFSKSDFLQVVPPELKKTIEDYHMLCCDFVPDTSVDEDVIHTLIFPSNRGFFHIRSEDDELEIVCCYYCVDRNKKDGSYSIYINNDLYSGPFAAEDESGYQAFEASVYRNIGEWRRDYGIR